jgi:NADPH oxidase
VPRSIRRVLDKNLTFHKAIAWVIIVSSAMHVMAHYYNYERLTRYSPPNSLPPGEQAQVPLQALPANGTIGALNPIQVCFRTCELFVLSIIVVSSTVRCWCYWAYNHTSSVPNGHFFS